MDLSRSGFALFFALAMSAGIGSAAAGEDIVEAARAEAQDKHGVDVKKIFGSQCGLCHGGYGTSMGGRGGGPKLSATAMTPDQVHSRISDGKQGMMPSFKKMLKPEEIDALVTYIMALKSLSK